MSSRIEVLAPAGSMEILKTAICAGADAVYVGGARFGARAYADNFDEDTLVEAVHYVHLHGKKLYLTVNTLLMQEELDTLHDFLRVPYEAGLDAVIVQDVGVASYIRRQFPDLALHISTQMTVTQACGASLMKELSATRIVPARELSLAELRRIKESTGLELEVFVHGALCYCYSGQCLLSSLIGGRSGNRGRCAQPCRLSYHLQGDAYLLSPKDLCALDILPQLISSGVDSLKIEGRMKNSYYVAATVSAYRQAVDAVLAGTYDDGMVRRLKRQMAEIYNRGGFTEGYFTRHNGPEMMSMDRPNHQGIYVGQIEELGQGSIVFTAMEALTKGDVIGVVLHSGEEISLTVPADCKMGSRVSLRAGKTRQMQKGMALYRTKNAGLIAYLEEQYINKPKKEKIKIEVIIKKDLCATMKLSLGETKVIVEGGMVTKACKQPVTKESILDKVSKLGNTPFVAEDICIEADDDAFLPIKELNELRRAGVELLTKQLEQRGSRLPVERVLSDGTVTDAADMTAGQKQERIKQPQSAIVCPRLSAQVMNRRVLETVLEHEEVSRVYLDCITMSDKEAYEAMSRVRQAGRELIICMPHVFRYDTMQRFEAFLAEAEPYDGLLVRNIDSFAYVKSDKRYDDKVIVGDYSLYAYNHSALAYYEECFQDMQFVMPRELSYDTLKKLWRDESHKLICDIYGNVPVMVSAQCMQKNTEGCNHQSDRLYMKDRKHVGYTVQCVCKDCYNLIYNGIEYQLLDALDDVRALHCGEIRMLFRDEDSDWIAKIIHAASTSEAGNARELFEQQGIKTTKGHFRRGIE